MSTGQLFTATAPTPKPTPEPPELFEENPLPILYYLDIYLLKLICLIKSNMSFYAVAKGKLTGIFNTWSECKSNTDGYKGAVFKKFSTKEEAEAFIVYNTNAHETNAFDILMKAKKKTETKAAEIDNAFEPEYYVYTDGSCSENGKENALAGMGIYFGENDTRNVSQRVTGKQTNNTAELGAILHVYEILEQDIVSGKKIGIVSDSKYAIGCVTTYGSKCEQEGWTKDIPNKDMVKRTFELYKDKLNVKFLHVMAHTGKLDIHSIGNDGADKLANKAIGLDNCPYNNKAKIHLTVPFSKKDIVKELGGRWDASKKLWYILESYSNKEHILSMFKQAI